MDLIYNLKIYIKGKMFIQKIFKNYKTKYIFKIIFFIFLVTLSSCVSKNKYNKDNQKIILGRITVENDGIKYDFTQLVHSDIDSFIKQPKITINLFKDDTRGNGLVVANAYKKEYKINNAKGKNGNFYFDAKFPTIIIKIGEEKGIYYFGYIKLFYQNGKLVDIVLFDNKEKDFKKAKSYIHDFKELNIIDLTSEIQKQIQLNFLKH